MLRDDRRPVPGSPVPAQAKLKPLLRDLRSGALSLEAYVERLERTFAQREPQLQSFVPEEGRFERLRREARLLQERYPQPELRPPLYGVALGVKDIFHVSGFTTHAGAKVPEKKLQGEEAAVVSALKKAGVLILGKTVTTEFAYFAPGPTRNPYHEGHTPGGSSSGSAAAVGAGLCPLALGTQTIGSINRPAAFCGVVGLKPSYDRISRAGVIPVSPSLDHVGLFTRDLFGMALVASLLLARWQPPSKRTKPVLGIPQGPYLQRASAPGLAHFESTCRRLAQAGIHVKEVPVMSDFESIEARHHALMAAEAAQVHDEWFAKYDHLYHPKTAALLTRGAVVSREDARVAREGRQQLRRELMSQMESHGIDLWLTPAAPGTAPAGLQSTGDPVMNLPWTYSGLPSLSLPSGFDDEGLPYGLQLVGAWMGDERLLAQAANVVAVLGDDPIVDDDLDLVDDPGEQSVV